MNFTIYATRVRSDRREVIVSQRTQRPTFFDLQLLKTCLLMRSEEFDDATQLRVEETL